MMKKIIIGLVIAAAITAGIAWPKSEAKPEDSDPGPAPEQRQKSIEEIRVEKVKEYLEKKESPLAEHAEKIAGRKHWRILIAISAIESQYCKRKIAYNCWGLGGDSHYQKYTGYDEAIEAADALIEKFQSRGKWMTVKSMMGSYVVPGSPNWERTVNGTLKEIEYIN
jgi:hypothetical protein